MSARPILRIAAHEPDDTGRGAQWSGWFVECRRADGTVAGVHPARGLHGSQGLAFRVAIAHVRAGGCGGATGSEP